MSNTRYAPPNSVLSQERFASSICFQRGLMGNLVAKRAALLTDQAEIELIWTLQYLSWQPGGLEHFAKELLAAFPERITTRTLEKYGVKPGQIYDAKRTETVTRELNCPTGIDPEKAEIEERIKRELARRKPREFKPTPATELLAHCRCTAALFLAEDISALCLNPHIDLSAYQPRYFPRLVESLRDHLAARLSPIRDVHVVTEIGRQIWDTLDYCRNSRCMVLIDGLARTGKTVSARKWCELRPGSARYIQCPSSNDDVGFFRAVARAVGVSINQNSKAQQLRDRCEDVLQRGHLTAVFDEAHYAWPQSNYREALPGRINWIMTALVNHGVPVALVTTPQFIRAQKSVERKSFWTSEQFTGRIGHYQKLPDSLEEKDLSAVAKYLLSEGCARSIEALVRYAQGSAKYLAAIEAIVRRSRYLAEKVGRRKVVFSDIKSAITESVIPSDNALALALSDTKKGGRMAIATAPLPPVLPDTAPRLNGASRGKDLAATASPGADRAGVLKVAA